MNWARNTVANVLVGLVVVLVAAWLLRSVFRFVYGAGALVVLVIVVVLVLRLAAKIRG